MNKRKKYYKNKLFSFWRKRSFEIWWNRNIKYDPALLCPIIKVSKEEFAKEYSDVISAEELSSLTKGHNNVGFGSQDP